MDLSLSDNEGQGILKILLSSRVVKPTAGISWLWRTQQHSDQGHAAAFPRDLGTERKEGQANPSFLVKSYIPQRFSLKNTDCCSCSGFILGTYFSSRLFSSSRYLFKFLLTAFVTSLPSRHPNIKVNRVLVDKTRLLDVNYQQTRDQSRVKVSPNSLPAATT